MRMWVLIVSLALTVTPAAAQTTKTPAKKTSSAAKKTQPARKAAAAPPTRVQAVLQCPSELGVGVRTGRDFCDVLAGREPLGGILVTIPPHRGPVTLSFELHNRHTYSEDLVKSKTAYRKYTATIGVLTMDNTLVQRAVIQSEFRAERDLFDRIGGGAGPGGVKAVAPSGTEIVSIELAEDIGEQVTILGEKLSVERPGGVDNFVSPGRPVATISNVMVEYRPAPPPRKTATKKKP
jgi:hypothetical protein